MQTTNNSKRQWPVIWYMLIFFMGMISHEIALEAISTQFSSDLDELASSVTLFQFGFCFIIPILLNRQALETFPRAIHQTFPYVKLSLLVFCATSLSTLSLKYVSFPTKVVFKSAKLIPTMIVSTIINRENTKKHGFLDYCAALFLCLGAAGFGFGDHFNEEETTTTTATSTNKHGLSSSSSIGVILLIISVSCDAIVPNLQQKLMSTPLSTLYGIHTLPQTISDAAATCDTPQTTRRLKMLNEGLSAHAVMINVNAIVFGTLLLTMTLSGSLFKAIRASIADPYLFCYLICVGLGLSFAVLAYTKLIKASGSVFAVTVATLRKVTTILLSYTLFPKKINKTHFVSGFFVILGILINSFCKSKQKKKLREKQLSHERSA